MYVTVQGNSSVIKTSRSSSCFHLMNFRIKHTAEKSLFSFTNKLVPSETKGSQDVVAPPQAPNKNLGLKRWGGIFLSAKQLENLTFM